MSNEESSLLHGFVLFCFYSLGCKLVSSNHPAINREKFNHHKESFDPQMNENSGTKSLTLIFVKFEIPITLLRS